MTRYFLHKLLVFALSMAIAASLFIFSFSVPAVGLFHSDGYVENGLKQNSDAIIQTVDAELEKTAKELSLPEDIFDGAITKQNISIITNEVSHNFIYGYATSFSNSTDLYSAIVSAVSGYNNEHNLKMSDVDISRVSALAVDSVNEAIGNSDTQNVSVFAFVRGRIMIFILGACIVILIASIIALEFLNNGRHRKYNYIGMGLTTGGFSIMAASVLIVFKDYLSQYRFCTFDAYDSAVKYCISTLFAIVGVLGGVYFVIGFIMLAKNYRYFKIRKDAFIERHKNTGTDKMSDYMDDYFTKNTRTHVPGEEFEREIKKIDFEQDFDEEEEEEKE